MNVGEILTDLGSGLASIVPAFFKAIWTGFCNLFLTFTESEGVITVTGFNVLGSLCLAFFVFYACYKIIPMVTSFLGKKIGGRKKARARK